MHNITFSILYKNKFNSLWIKVLDQNQWDKYIIRKVKFCVQAQKIEVKEGWLNYRIYLKSRGFKCPPAGWWDCKQSSPGLPWWQSVAPRSGREHSPVLCTGHSTSWALLAMFLGDQGDSSSCLGHIQLEGQWSYLQTLLYKKCGRT